jgi:hypothetical protein
MVNLITHPKFQEYFNRKRACTLMTGAARRDRAGDLLIPLFYRRDQDGLPRGWIKRMKRTIRTLGWRFNADRMVMGYTLHSYIPAAGAGRAICRSRDRIVTVRERSSHANELFACQRTLRMPTNSPRQTLRLRGWRDFDLSG